MLLRHCEARPYAAYGSGKHRRHIHRLLAILRAGLCAAIFTNAGAVSSYIMLGDCLHARLVNCY